MRRWILVALLAGVTGCRQQADRPVAGDGRLVLELGGKQKSLAASLVGLGVELLPPRQTPPSAVASPPDDAAGAGKDGAASDGSARDADAARSDRGGGSKEAAAPPAWFEVELQSKQTLMDLAHKHLGSGLRFKEILALNGWTEKDARRLKVGQKVKIPRLPQ